VVLVDNVNEKIVVLLGHADIGIFVLNGHELAVLGSSDGVQEGGQVYAVAVDFVDFDFAALQAVAIDGGKNFFGEFERDIDADGLSLGVGILNTDMEPAVSSGRFRRLGRAILGDYGHRGENQGGCDQDEGRKLAGGAVHVDISFSDLWARTLENRREV
jgi:hypothetical protein